MTPAIRLGGEAQPWDDRGRARPRACAAARSRSAGSQTRAISTRARVRPCAPARLARQRRHLARGARPALRRRPAGDRLRPARVRHRAAARLGLGARPAGRVRRRRGRGGGRGVGAKGRGRRQLARRAGSRCGSRQIRTCRSPGSSRSAPPGSGWRRRSSPSTGCRRSRGSSACRRRCRPRWSARWPDGFTGPGLRRSRRGRQGGGRPLHPLSRRPAGDPRRLEYAKRLRAELDDPFDAEAIKVPVSVIWGEADRLCVPAGAAELAEALPARPDRDAARRRPHAADRGARRGRRRDRRARRLGALTGRRGWIVQRNPRVAELPVSHPRRPAARARARRRGASAPARARPRPGAPRARPGRRPRARRARRGGPGSAG